MEVPPQSPFVDTIITALTFLVPFILAAVFLHGWLFRDYETKRQWVQYLFAATFALSVNLLLLALYEILGVLEPATRWLTWRLVLVVLALDLVVVLPFSFVFVLATDSGLNSRLANLLGVVAEAAFLYVFWRLGDFFPILHGGQHDLFSVEGAIGRLGIAGVTTAAILSGYGAVSTPYNYLAIFSQDVSERDLKTKQSQLRRQVDALLSKQRGLNVARARLSDLRDELARAEDAKEASAAAAAASSSFSEAASGPRPAASSQQQQQQQLVHGSNDGDLSLFDSPPTGRYTAEGQRNAAALQQQQQQLPPPLHQPQQQQQYGYAAHAQAPSSSSAAALPVDENDYLTPPPARSAALLTDRNTLLTDINSALLTDGSTATGLTQHLPGSTSSSSTRVSTATAAAAAAGTGRRSLLQPTSAGYSDIFAPTSSSVVASPRSVDFDDPTAPRTKVEVDDPTAPMLDFNLGATPPTAANFNLGPTPLVGTAYNGSGEGARRQHQQRYIDHTGGFSMLSAPLIAPAPLEFPTSTSGGSGGWSGLDRNNEPSAYSSNDTAVSSSTTVTGSDNATGATVTAGSAATRRSSSGGRSSHRTSSGGGGSNNANGIPALSAAVGPMGVLQQQHTRKGRPSNVGIASSWQQQQQQEHSHPPAATAVSGLQARPPMFTPATATTDTATITAAGAHSSVLHPSYVNRDDVSAYAATQQPSIEQWGAPPSRGATTAEVAAVEQWGAPPPRPFSVYSAAPAADTTASTVQQRQHASSYATSSSSGSSSTAPSAVIPRGGGGRKSLVASGGGFIARALGAVFTRGVKDERLLQLETDVAAYTRAVTILRDMQEEMFLELVEMTDARARAVASRTLRGRALNLLGYFMLVYCLYKMAMSLFNIVLRRDPTKDPVTLGFQLALTYAGVEQERARMWVQPVSLLFVGVLVFTSVRGFLVSFSNVFVAWSSSVTSNSVVILLAAVMGMYFISSVLLMRMSMPEEYREGITRAIGDIQFPFFHRWFDVIFLLSAISSIVVFQFVNATRQSRTSISEEERSSLVGTSNAHALSSPREHYHHHHQLTASRKQQQQQQQQFSSGSIASSTRVRPFLTKLQQSSEGGTVESGDDGGKGRPGPRGSSGNIAQQQQQRYSTYSTARVSAASLVNGGASSHTLDSSTHSATGGARTSAAAAASTAGPGTTHLRRTTSAARGSANTAPFDRNASAARAALFDRARHK